MSLAIPGSRRSLLRNAPPALGIFHFDQGDPSPQRLPLEADRGNLSLLYITRRFHPKFPRGALRAFAILEDRRSLHPTDTLSIGYGVDPGEIKFSVVRCGAARLNYQLLGGTRAPA